MTILGAIILTMLSFAFVAYPLFKQRLTSEVSTGDEKYRELYSRRDTTYAMLKELEFDFQSGILTEEDYRDLEVRYKRTAISILRETDDLEKRFVRFNLTLSGSDFSFFIGGTAIFTFQQSEVDGKWRIVRWKDETDL